MDALTAAPLAKSLDAPILLTRGDKVPDATLEALEQLQVQEVYTVTGALKKADLEKFFADKELEITITELGGKDRFETSANIADQLENVENVVIAYAYKNADAVSVASAAAIENMPILLTKKNVLPDPQADYLATIKDQVQKTYVVGGEAAISPEVFAELPGTEDESKFRIAGNDRS